MTTMPVAVLSNPLSELNKRGMADIEACLAGRPDVIHVVFEPGLDLAEVLADLARREVGLLVVNSGDGLVHGLLGALFAGGNFAAPPPLAIMPRGMTNMTAADVGVGGRDARTLASVLDIVRRGEVDRHLVRRQVFKVDYDPGKLPERGMFFGAAGIYDAIQLCTGQVHTQGLKGAWANAATLLTILGRALVRGPAAAGLGGDAIGVGLGGAALETRPRTLVLATTLDRLVLGSRPFWGTGEAPIHFTVFDHPATGLVRHTKQILWGGKTRTLPDPPYFSAGAARVELELERQFTIDGEFFQPAPGYKVLITAEDKVRFLKLRP
jgi:diacylglycerol kinase (ATP)